MLLKRKVQKKLHVTLFLPRLSGGAAFLILQEELAMQTRVAVMSIIVEDRETVRKLNELLHEYGEYILGRMGIPYRAKGIHIISIAIDAPQDLISTLAGKIGGLPGVSVKTALSSVKSDE